jgi:hypothetical protein
MTMAPDRTIEIIKADESDFDGIWEIFHQVVERGDTYPYHLRRVATIRHTGRHGPAVSRRVPIQLSQTAATPVPHLRQRSPPLAEPHRRLSQPPSRLGYRGRRRLPVIDKQVMHIS